MATRSPTTAVLLVTVWIDPSQRGRLRVRVRATGDVVDGQSWDRSCANADEVLDAVAQWIDGLGRSHDGRAAMAQPAGLDDLGVADSWSR